VNVNKSCSIPEWKSGSRSEAAGLRAWKQRMLLAERLDTLEILDRTAPDAETLRRTYWELNELHRWLGNQAAVLRRLREAGVGRESRVLDLGCGQGALLREVNAQLGCSVVGVDLRGGCAEAQVEIVRADAVTDPLPEADVAVCVVMAHHLDPARLQAMIANVARSCETLVLLDLIRHPLPLALFRTFVAPLLSHINAADGETSIRRAYTAREMRAIVEKAVNDCGRPVREVRHNVAWLWLRQVVTVRWG
jgi:SAM-dependent methyltransferase